MASVFPQLRQHSGLSTNHTALKFLPSEAAPTGQGWRARWCLIHFCGVEASTGLHIGPVE